MNHQKPLAIKSLLLIAFLLEPNPQAKAQLSKFNKIFPTGSLASSDYREVGFAESNAVSWAKPADSLGITSISTNRALVTLSVDANSAKGTLVGGQILFPDAVKGPVANAESFALSSAVIPNLGADGLITVPAGTGFTATQLGVFPGWTYNASLKQGDTPNTSTGIGVVGGGEFTDQEGKGSNVNNAFIAINPQGAIQANPGQGNGTRVTVQIYSEKTLNTDSGTSEYSENGQAQNNFSGLQLETRSDSLNDQSSYNALSTAGQGARASQLVLDENELVAGGPVTSGGFNVAGGALGDALLFNNAAPAPAAAPGNYYTVVHSQAGENSEPLNVSSVASTGPSYGDKATTAGGTTAAAISFTNINNLSTGGGGAPATTEMTTCTTAAYECGGGANVGDTTATYIKLKSDGSFTAFY